MSSSSGTFKTGTGAVSINGDAPLAAGKTIKFTGSPSGRLTQTVPTTVTNSTATWPGAVAATSGSILTSDTSGNLAWTPTLPVANGGTGLNSIANNSMIYASAANT